MPLKDENAEFADRLKRALKRGPKSIETSTELAHHFNLRHKNDPITVQAAHKWMQGKGKPTQDKIDTLAEWLGVSAHWLKNGPPTVKPKKTILGNRKSDIESGASTLTAVEMKLLLRFRHLTEHQAYLIVEMVDQFALEHEMWAGPSQN
ncbi:MAG: transcriptional regulator [Actinomycetota bacterium]|nr:transcriptional regulator [Actinomycetota bacterium]